MLKVTLIGTGNISKFLFKVLSDHPEVAIVQVLGRSDKALEHFRDRTAVSIDLREIKKADVYILAISDEAIGEVAHSLEIGSGLLVHTAGSIPMEVLPARVRRGVLYPLQTLSGILPEKMMDIPICIEASEEEDYLILEKLAHFISPRVEHINSDQRKHLHLAAVFANNFSNHLFFLSSEICEDHGVDFDLIRPLIRESYTKVLSQSPYDAQTGPARRGDNKTMDAHLEMLRSPRLKEIYELLSKSIQNTYGKEL
ncbi:Predicted oxidoreductase, contains short-chain dehydrogenase (SDR) and DUF2520 domains [Muriicola jejuensis]|uniref:DUF2520 domain-containing protein n=1 Tax=Muriicola jejuensis TaxID=504488 RepID=A0A6P0UHZ8_9FLAO|nr:Rossmann-like and DUF2520 domain-containing protein [Muriicola jejuensis]NER11468.1 DUF2520 domain-containing protein [Muriicola jejuensis]SMP20613.1 Predicted oxidoreductase, contains short-chain dehydrogenase (SDR) and DUF2520 domains [Muriicola jejuensis]